MTPSGFAGLTCGFRASERGQLPEGEFFRSDLIGCVVNDEQTGERIGVVRGWQQYGGPPLMEVDVQGREVLIPFVPEICRQVDLAAKTIIVALPRDCWNCKAARLALTASMPERPDEISHRHDLSGVFAGPFDIGVVAKAQQAGRLEIRVHDLRNWTYDRHRTVDDRPFGGGEGMLLKPQPLV